jgi:hypothetical protein
LKRRLANIAPPDLVTGSILETSRLIWAAADAAESAKLPALAENVARDGVIRARAFGAESWPENYARARDGKTVIGQSLL